MKRSRLKRSTPEQVNAWRRRSKRLTSKPKPSSELAQARIAVQRRSGGLCEADTPDCPPGPHEGVHAHHKRLRSQGGGHDPALMVWVCSVAHSWIHSHPMQAHAFGLILRAGD